MKRLFTILSMICAVLFVGGCSDREAASPDYELAEGLQLIAKEELYTGMVSKFSDATILILYSDTFPFDVYDGATITISPLSEKRFFFEYRNEEQNRIEAVPTISTNDLIFFPSFLTPDLGLPGCSRDGYMCNLIFLLPTEAGDYDFRLLIDNPSKNMYYKTHDYRLSIRNVDNRNLYSISTYIIN